MADWGNAASPIQVDKWGSAASAIEEPKPDQAQQGFTQRVGQAYDRRVSAAQDLANRGVSGQQTMAETIPEMGAQLVAGPINDVVKEGIASVTPFLQKQAADIPGLQSYSNEMNKAVIPAVNSAAQYVGDKYGQAEKAFPRVTNALNALATTAQAAGTVVPAMGMAAKTGPTVSEAASAAGSAAKSTAGAVKDALTPSAPIPSSEQVFAEGSKAYNYADQAGASLKPQATNDFIKQATKEAGQNAASLKMSGADDVTRLLDGNGKDTGISSFLNQPLTLQDAHAMDKDIGDAITSNLRSGNDAIANRLGKIQQALRDHLMNPAPENINGGADGFAAWKEGNRLWSQASRLSDVENIQKNAIGADVPATAIKNGAKALLKKVNASGGRGWSEEQVAALTHAAQTGVMSNALKTAGSKLIPIIASGVGATVGYGSAGAEGAMLGSTLAAGVTYPLTRGLAAASEGLQAGRVNNVRRAIVDNPKFTLPASEAAPVDTSMRLLPPPKYEMAVDSAGNAVPAIANQAARQNAESLGLTPDVQRNISRLEIRQKMGSVFDKIDQQQQAEIAKQINDAWAANKTPLTELIKQAKQSAEDFAAAKGEEPFNPAVKNALLKAKLGQPMNPLQRLSTKRR